MKHETRLEAWRRLHANKNRIERYKISGPLVDAPLVRWFAAVLAKDDDRANELRENVEQIVGKAQ